MVELSKEDADFIIERLDYYRCYLGLSASNLEGLAEYGKRVERLREASELQGKSDHCEKIWVILKKEIQSSGVVLSTDNATSIVEMLNGSNDALNKSIKGRLKQYDYSNDLKFSDEATSMNDIHIMCTKVIRRLKGVRHG